MLLAGCQQEHVVELRLIETADIHGNYYPDPNVQNDKLPGSMAAVYTYVKQLRQQYDDRLLLVDNGDILQGQPIAYYYNYIDTISPHLTAEMMNYMGYNAAQVGNHDIETGWSVFERWRRDSDFPILGANVVDERTGQPHFTPYVVLEREGIRIAFLGLVTSAIPIWVPSSQWTHLRFEDMEESVRRWLPIIRAQERPDLIVGLFHSGANAYTIDRKYRENASVEAATKVPGFDLILYGHDHLPACRRIANLEGDSVLMVNPGSGGENVADVTVKLHIKKGEVVGKELDARLVSMKNFPPDAELLKHFARERRAVDEFVTDRVGILTESISTRDVYFGPSPFISLMHLIQLEVTGADVSLASPLAYNIELKEGDVTVADLFRFYTFENLIYTIEMTGAELKDELEMSYNQWTNRMLGPGERLLLLRDSPLRGNTERAYFVYYTSNFDSAAGIEYVVDVTKPMGNKVRILRMADGRPFRPDGHYRVAVNSYRGNGGGELLTKGAGIPFEQLKGRTRYISPYDFRFYLIHYLNRHRPYTPTVLGHWKFIPEAWTVPAGKRDYEYLFGARSEEQ
jgi:2',3'-cyclic-nucleotide 2'-phosphodiesterase/3'-nucleotidase